MERFVKALNEKLACAICHGPVHTAMMTPCSHNFCSLCIRKHVSKANYCPMCKQGLTVRELRNNRVIDEIVLLAQDFEKSVLPERNGIPCGSSPANAEAGCSSKFECGPSGAGKTKTVGEGERSPVCVETLVVAGPSQDRAAGRVGCPVCSKEVLPDEINDHLDKFHFGGNAGAPPDRRAEPPSHDSPTKNAFSILGSSAGQSLGSRGSKGKAGSTGDGKPLKRRPMPNLCYTIMSEKELRKKCRLAGLSDKGNKKALTDRHQKYTLMYNAELDSLNPRSESELIQLIEREEREKAGNSAPSPVRTSKSKSRSAKNCSELDPAPGSRFHRLDRNADPVLVEKERRAYLLLHKKHFDELVERARQNLLRKKNGESEKCVENLESKESEKAKESSNACDASEVAPSTSTTPRGSLKKSRRESRKRVQFRSQDEIHVMTPADCAQASRGTHSSVSDCSGEETAEAPFPDEHKSSNSALDDSDLFENGDEPEFCDDPFVTEVFTQRVQVSPPRAPYVCDDTSQPSCEAPGLKPSDESGKNSSPACSTPREASLEPDQLPRTSSLESRAKKRKRDAKPVESFIETVGSRAVARTKKIRVSMKETSESEDDPFEGDSSGDEFVPKVEEKRCDDSDDDEFLSSPRRPSVLKRKAKPASAAKVPRKATASENRGTKKKPAAPKRKETAEERILRETYENVGPEAFVNSMTPGRPKRTLSARKSWQTSVILREASSTITVTEFVPVLENFSFATMGRLSDKAKLRKQQKKAEKLRLSEYEAAVKAAKAQADPLAKFVPFKKFKSKGDDAVEFTLSCVRAEDLSEELREWVFDLTMRNMIHLYESSNWGWDPVDKKEDLYHKDSLFLIAVDREEVPVGFVCFRFDMDYGVPVSYCYEIQLERGSRRCGLGRHLFTVLELMAFSARMHKVVLTVFHHNVEGRKFFEALGYSLDDSSPGTFDDVGFGEGVHDYDILSKVNKRLLAVTQANGHRGQSR